MELRLLSTGFVNGLDLELSVLGIQYGVNFKTMNHHINLLFHQPKPTFIKVAVILKRQSNIGFKQYGEVTSNELCDLLVVV